MKVLVAVDFSECSLRALDSVRHQKWDDNTEVRVLYVVEPVYVSYGITGAYIQPMLDAHVEYMQNYRRLIEDRVRDLRTDIPNCNITGTVIEGSPAATILDEAGDWDADLIIMGSHGRTGIQRFLMGSVAQRVASNAPCTVNIVKQKKEHKDQKPKTPADAMAI